MATWKTVSGPRNRHNKGSLRIISPQTRKCHPECVATVTDLELADGKQKLPEGVASHAI